MTNGLGLGLYDSGLGLGLGLAVTAFDGSLINSTQISNMCTVADTPVMALQTTSELQLLFTHSTIKPTSYARIFLLLCLHPLGAAMHGRTDVHNARGLTKQVVIRRRKYTVC